MQVDLDRTVFEIFADVATCKGDKPALDDGERYFTYNEVHDHALKLARRIASVAPRGTPVGVLLPNAAAFPVAMLAVLAAGCPVIALDPSFPETRNAFIARHAGMKAIIVDDTTRDHAAKLGIPQLNFTATGDDPEARLLPGTPDDIAVISYTSGSTGEPKGVFHTNRNLIHHVMLRRRVTPLTTDDRVALLTGTTVLLATNDILSGLLSGATLFVVDLRRNGLQELVRVMRRGRITTMRTLPVVMRQLIKLRPDPEVFAHLRHILLSSDRLFSADVELLRSALPRDCGLSASMGSTETQMVAHWLIPPDRPMTEPIVPVGHIQMDFNVTLIDDTGAPVAPGEVGEIVVTGRYLALGYWRNEAETRRVFSRTANDSAMRSYRTGDLGRMSSEGLLELRGRKDRQVKIRGNRVEPLEIEAAIRAHPDVRDAAVIVRRDGDAAELVAYVAADRADGLSEWLRDRLPEPMRPLHIFPIDEIPMLGNFKHDLRALENLDRNRAAISDSGVKARREQQNAYNHMRDAVHAAWARLLGVEAAEGNKPWEDAGGESVKSLELIFELERALGRRISMRILGPSTRPSDLIASLLGGKQELDDQRQLLFLLGASGDFLSLLRLAQCLSGTVRVEVLDYAPVNPADLQFITLDNLVADVIQPIRMAAQRGGAIRVLGWSLGGFVAMAAAHKLAAEGYNVEFVGLLDTSSVPLRWDGGKTDFDILPRHLADQMNMPITGHIIRRVKKRTVLQVRPNRVAARILERLLHQEQVAVVGMLWRFLNMMRLHKLSVRVRMKVTRFIQARAVITSRAQVYCPKRLVLFRSMYQEWDRLGMPDDLGWGQFCAEVSVYRVPGDHWSLMAADNVQSTANAIIAALHESSKRTWRHSGLTTVSDIAPVQSPLSAAP